MFKQGRKKVICIILTLTLVGTMSIPSVGFAESGTDTITVSSEKELTEALKADAGDAVIQMDDSITLSSMLEIPDGKKITLQGKNGNEKLTISLTKAEYKDAERSKIDALLTVKGSLEIADLILDAEKNMRVMYIGGSGSVTLNDGAVITGGTLGKTTLNYGAGILMQGTSSSRASSLILNDGAEIRDNQAYGVCSVTGIGVCVYKYGTITMNGGAIENNRDLLEGESGSYRDFSYGGGVSLNGKEAKLVIKDGRIANNSAKGGGGGVYAAASGVFDMQGGTIADNSTTISGAGVHIGTVKEAVMSGGTISGNKAEADNAATTYACGGGVYIEAASSETSSGGVFAMEGGTISENTANSTAAANLNDAQIGQGGGVMADGEFLMSGGTISGNSASSAKALSGTAACGGGISVKGGNYPGSFKMTGGTISNNTAKNHGGAVYINNKHLDQSTMYPTESAVLQEGAGSFECSGEIKITGNKAGSSNDNVYLPENAIVTIVDELNTGSEILLGTEITELGTAVAEGGEGYTLTAADARRLKSNEGKGIYQRNAAGKAVISEEQSGEYINIGDAVISGLETEYVYTGEAIQPKPTVTLGEEELEEGTDYTLSYKKNGYDNKNVSSGETSGIVRVIGAGAYTGEKDAAFKITAKNMNDVQIETISDRIYTGEAITPKIKAYNGNIALTENTDFELSYDTNTDIGNGTVVIKGIHNYTGEVHKNFKIISSDGLVTADSEESLAAAVQSVQSSEGDPDTIYIMKNIDLTESLEIPEGKYIRVLGNGDQITLSPVQAMENMLEVKGNLTTENITLDADSKGRSIKVAEKGSLTVSQGTEITKGLLTAGVNAEDYSGGGIYNEGTLTITAGELYENTAKNGGAVYNAPAGKFMMSDALIHENTATAAGGGIANGGTAELGADAVVSDNQAKSSAGNEVSGKGGGIYNTGTLVCKADSLVEANNGEDNGGGVFTSKEMVLEGGKILNNKTSGTSRERVNNCGGGVYVDAGTFTMISGEITDNTANSNYIANDQYGSLANGGGVYVNNSRENALFAMSGGKISGNRAVSKMDSEYFGHGGGVYVMGGKAASKAAPGKFTMTGGEITGNYATGSGAGLYLGNKEKYTISRVDYLYEGPALCEMSGKAAIQKNNSDNAYLTSGVTIAMDDSLSGGTIGVTAGGKGTVSVAEGSDYTVSNGDKEHFVSDEELRKISLDEQNNRIVMEAVELAEGFEIQLESDSYEYTGTEIKPAVKVVSEDGTVLKENQDFEVEYDGSGISAKKLINTGKKEVIINGTGNYTGTLTKNYEITARDISQASAAIGTQYYYTGAALTPNLTSITYNSISLLKGTDYKLTYKNNQNQGTATVVISGTGNFKGSKSLTFKIIKMISKTTIGAVSNKTYTGKAIKPALTVKYGTSLLKNGPDYTVSYKNNTAPGKATATITGKGYYSGKKTITFKIVPKKTSLSKVSSAKKGQLTVKWKRDSKATGYQVVIAKNKKFKTGKKTANITKNKTTSKTFKKLTKGKKYYAKVRAYKTIDGKKVYGAYGNIKSKKVKR